MNGSMRLATLGVALSVGSLASGTPVAGFLPLVGIGLTDEFETIDDDILFFTAKKQTTVSGSFLGTGTPYFDLALLDTGANGSLLTHAAHASFDLDGNEFDGTKIVTVGGATGTMDTVVSDPLSIYATGLAAPNRQGTTPFTLDTDTMVGQMNVALLTMPEESELPNVLGLPFASQFATYIRNDMPQIFQHNGRTVRTPHVEFLPLGDGGTVGIARRAPLSLQPGTSFASSPLYVFNFENIGNGLPFHEDPTAHTHHNDGTASRAAMFVSVNVENEGETLDQFDFFFDTGADVTVVSELNAARLGFDVVLDVPEFTVAVVGSGGARLEVPGFFVDEFTIEAVGGSLTLQNVPVVVLNVTNPADPGNIVDGIVGTNLLAGRNVVIDPDPSLGGGNLGPQLYIGNSVTTNHSWAATASSANWATPASWSAPGTPGVLGVANVNHVSGSNQTAVVSAPTEVWEVNIGSSSASQMTVRVDSGATLTTFSGVNVHEGGRVQLNGGTIDAQYVEIREGTLIGSGVISTGSGPIPGQVENVNGVVAPGNGAGAIEIEGRFANGRNATLQMELGGTIAVSGYDQLIVDGGVTLAGTLEVFLINSFAPTPGYNFTLINATGALVGEFDTLHIPDDYYWDIDYGETSLELSMAGAVIVGDFNLDRTVNAADYAVWRDTLGDSGNYNLWRAHFGDTFSPGSGMGHTVPEPAAWVSALTLVAWSLARRRQPISRNSQSLARSRS
jgi:hypothetical protein